MSLRITHWLGVLGVAVMVSVAGSSFAQTSAGVSSKSGGLKGDYYSISDAMFPAANPDQGNRPDRTLLFAAANYKKSRLDPRLNIAFSDPPIPGGPGNDYYAARWTGQLQAQFMEDYKFYGAADDGIRVWLSEAPIDPANPGTPIIPNCTFDATRLPNTCTDINADSWRNQGDGNEYASAPIALNPAKKYNVMVEFYEKTGGNAVRFRWSSPSQAKGAVPQWALFPTVAVANDPGPPEMVVPTADPATVTTNSIAIKFAAPAPDPGGTTGKVTDYDIRYSRMPFSTTPFDPNNSRNFYTVSRLGFGTTPKGPGGAETYFLRGLQPLTTYYISIRASDEQSLGDPSPLLKVTTKNLDLTQSIYGERWLNIGGGAITDLTNNNHFKNDPPDQDFFDTTFQTFSPNMDNYGTRVTGFITAPATGAYTFYIASDDDSQLFLSTNATPAGLSVDPIAKVAGSTGETEFTKFPEQKSAAITLTAGQKYYFLAYQKEGGGGDHGPTVQWTRPDGVSEIIPQSALSLPTGVVAPDRGRIRGQVFDSATGKPLNGANVLITVGTRKFNSGTDGNGFFTSLVDVGAATLKASAPFPFGGISSTVTTTVTKDVESTVNLSIGSIPQSFDANGVGLPTFSLNQGDLKTATLPTWLMFATARGNNPQRLEFETATTGNTDPLLNGLPSGNSDDTKNARWITMGMTGGMPFPTAGQDVPEQSGITALTDLKWVEMPRFPGNLGDNDANYKDKPGNIPDNTDWVQTLKFKIPAPVATAGNIFTVGNFGDFDDDAYVIALNGQKIHQNNYCCENITKGPYTVGDANFPLVLDPTKDNILTFVAHQGGGDGGVRSGDPRVRPFRILQMTDPAAAMSGDVNGDKKLSIKDATRSIQLALGLVIANDQQVYLGDVNHDNSLNVADTIMILKAIVGLAPLP